MAALEAGEIRKIDGLVVHGIQVCVCVCVCVCTASRCVCVCVCARIQAPVNSSPQCLDLSLALSVC